MRGAQRAGGRKPPAVARALGVTLRAIWLVGALPARRLGGLKAELNPFGGHLKDFVRPRHFVLHSNGWKGDHEPGNLHHDQLGTRRVRRLHRSLGRQYDKAVECLIKDRDALLAFYDFPAEHWKHLRTTNPIESSLQRIVSRTRPRSP